MKHPGPKWILSPVWGLAIDPLNWKLMKRGTNHKTGKPSRWRVVGYYPKLNMLVNSLAEKIMLADTDSTDLLDHLKQAQETGQDLGSTLNAALHTMDRVGPETLPPHYKSYQANKTIRLSVSTCNACGRAEVAQAGADRFLSVLATYPLPAVKARPATVTSLLKKETANHAS